MKLVHFQGLNCYQDSIVSIAAFMGVDYKLAFAALWSEIDFEYDSHHNVYLSKRMIDNLEMLGIKVEALRCNSKEEAVETLAIIEDGELFLVEMDTFYIPWTPEYGAAHDNHYFVAQKDNSELFFCFDPTYDKEYVEIAKDEITSHILTACRISQVAEKSFHIDMKHEAKAVMEANPKTHERLLAEFEKCINERNKNTLLLAKYIDTMINNRYLYKYYLENTLIDYDKYRLFFDKDFFLQWTAVKNGLYKAYVIKQNKAILDEISELFTDLMGRELSMAKEIVDLSL